MSSALSILLLMLIWIHLFDQLFEIDDSFCKIRMTQCIVLFQNLREWKSPNHNSLPQSQYPRKKEKKNGINSE